MGRAAASRAARTVLVALAMAASLPAAAAAQPTLAPANTVIDGPSPDIVGLSGMSVARDGMGGLVYVKNVLGTPHVFVSRLLGGTFQTPQQVDGGLAGASSQPVIGAGPGGLLLVGFVNGGQLFVASAPSSVAPLGAPQALFAGASNPALAVSIFGKGYLAFTAAGAGGHDVRAAYYNKGQWALESAPLDGVPGDDAGTGTGRPEVAAAGDGVGIVVWGESGHIDSRRVWGTAPSIVFEQADVPSVAGWSELASDDPAVSVGGDSSYADVAFHELLTNGSTQQSRVLMNRLHGSQYDGVTGPDGLTTPGPEGAVQPQVTMTEYGHGFVTSARDQSNQVFANVLGDNGLSQTVVRVDSLSNASAPYAVPATAGLYSTLIAWQHDPGIAGTPEIRARYAPDGDDLGPELVLSSPSLGPADAGSGLAAGGDVAGDAVVAWMQGGAGAGRIVTAQLYQPPGAPAALSRFRYATSAHPVLSWSPASGLWGVRYLVSVDGVQVAQTGLTAIRTPVALHDGPHRWQVTATNPSGVSNPAAAATVWVDTVRPRVSFSLSGPRRAGAYLHIYVSYTDSPRPEPPADASGVAEVIVKWGDRSSYRIKHGKFHAYKRPGHYLLIVIVRDRAGNTTTLVRRITIAPRSASKK
ncbi:MAG: hypothetical protein JO156_01345 [Solirubrobacterales bacterium]|nr:hypothetical protein [Solirubrobacterales bacterium]